MSEQNNNTTGMTSTLRNKEAMSADPSQTSKGYKQQDRIEPSAWGSEGRPQRRDNQENTANSLPHQNFQHRSQLQSQSQVGVGRATSRDEEGARGQTSQENAGQEYPPQLHAGHLDGVGPEYHKEDSLGNKIEGVKEQVKGHLTRDPDLVEHGKDKVSGRLAAKEREEDAKNNPFENAKDEK